MVNKQKAVKRDLTRLRKTQNPGQIDFRRMRKLRKTRIEFWKAKTVGVSTTVKKEVKAEKPKREKKKKEKEPELEILDEEPELEELDEELEELYSYDEDIEDEDDLIEDEENE